MFRRRGGFIGASKAYGLGPGIFSMDDVHDALAGAAAISYVTQLVSTSDLTTYTFSAASIGAAKTGRLVIVGITIAFGTARTISSVTIGGASASAVGSGAAATNTFTQFWAAVVDTGTTGDIVVTASGACVDCGIGVWAAYNLQSTAAVDTGSSTANPGSDTLSKPTGGVAVAIATNGGFLSTYTWTGLTESFDATVEAGSAHSYSGAMLGNYAGGDVSITATRATGGVSSAGMVTASFR